MVSANTMDAPVAKAVFVNQEEKVKIKPEELPEAVKTAVKEDYQGWEISQAYKYTLKENFEVELKKETETKTVKFDKEGNVID